MSHPKDVWAMVALSFPEVKDPVWFSVVCPALSFNQEKAFILEAALHAALTSICWVVSKHSVEDKQHWGI